jgi:PAS domain-containing protein
MSGQLIRPPQPTLVPVPVRSQNIRNLNADEWFGPLEPLQPIAPIGTQPRGFEYVPGQNLIWQPRADEPISFQDMIYMADNCDLVRVVIEALKDQICMREWQIRVVAQPGETQKERAARTASDPRITQWTSFFKWPNSDQCWSDFLRMLLEDLFVLDAPAVLLQKTRAGKLGALRVIDGQTITRLIDDNGFTPLPPDAAYQQILYGMPAVDLTTDDLLYRPRNQRARKIYGFSQVEQILLTLNIALRRQRFQLAYYTEGNVPEALYTMPKDITEDRIREFQQWFDLQNAGHLGHRRRIWFIPGDDKGVGRLHFTKEALLKDEADEWFARIICFAFRISPKELIKIMNRATAAESQDSSEEMGVHVMCEWIAETVNWIIQRKAGDVDIEFTFGQKREADVLKQAQADKIYVDSGIRTRNEVREDTGDDPSPDPNADILGVTTQQGFLPLDLAQQQVEAEIDATGAASSPGEKRPAVSGKKAPSPDQNSNSNKIFKVDGQPLPGLSSATSVANLRSELLVFFDKAADAAVGALDVLHKTEGHEDVDDLLDAIDAAIDWDALVEPATKEIQAGSSLGASTGIGQAQIHNISVVSRASEAAANYAKKRAAEMVGKRWKNGQLVDNPDAKWRIDKTTRNILRGLIEKAFSEGLSRHELAMRIKASSAFDDSRAKMIARTEIVRAQSMGQVAVWKAVETDPHVRWLAGGPNPCPLCIANQAAGPIQLGKEFPSGDKVPGAHPNCNCSLVLSRV